MYLCSPRMNSLQQYPAVCHCGTEQSSIMVVTFTPAAHLKVKRDNTGLSSGVQALLQCSNAEPNCEQRKQTRWDSVLPRSILSTLGFCLVVAASRREEVEKNPYLRESKKAVTPTVCKTSCLVNVCTLRCFVDNFDFNRL